MLFDTFSARSLPLANRMVMAPMTRSRATPQHWPNALMATYYGQHATAGLIITEGTSPSPHGLGYPRIPGLYDAAQADEQYLTLVHSLSALGLLYVHLVDHSSMGAPPVPADFKLKLRAGFDGLFILSGGFDHTSAEQALVDKRGDLIAFGRPFLANPDLVARMRQDAPFNSPDEATFYLPGAKGYTDYPALATPCAR